MSSHKKLTKPADPKSKSNNVSGASDKQGVEFEVSDEELDKAAGGLYQPAASGSCLTMDRKQ